MLPFLSPPNPLFEVYAYQTFFFFFLSRYSYMQKKVETKPSQWNLVHRPFSVLWLNIEILFIKDSFSSSNAFYLVCVCVCVCVCAWVCEWEIKKEREGERESLLALTCLREQNKRNSSASIKCNQRFNRLWIKSNKHLQRMIYVKKTEVKQQNNRDWQIHY